jgi:hypothetical protein
LRGFRLHVASVAVYFGEGGSVFVVAPHRENKDVMEKAVHSILCAIAMV